MNYHQIVKQRVCAGIFVIGVGLFLVDQLAVCSFQCPLKDLNKITHVSVVLSIY